MKITPQIPTQKNLRKAPKEPTNTYLKEQLKYIYDQIDEN